jgi:hypothetical protein
MQIIFAVVVLMPTALPNSTPAAHSSNLYPSAVDIRNTTTKIIGITLTTHRITTDYYINRCLFLIKRPYRKEES